MIAVAMARAMTRLDPTRASWLAALAMCGGCNGCGPGLLGDLPAETDGDALDSTTFDGDDATSTGDDAAKGEWQVVQLQTNKDIDILFVIDNSSSMSAAQADLGANLAGFIDALAADDVKANLRIAVTTTDLGNPWCGDTSPENGALVASSCAERLPDFGDQDTFESACLDHCGLASLPFLPTITALDPEPKVRPWIEVIEGAANLAEMLDDSSLGAAVQCLIPQGVAGCEYIAPIEAARRALERAQIPTDPAYGFVRDGAHLAVVFVTDGDDCSSPFEQRAIFLPPEDCYDADGDGDQTDDCTQVFWTDPSASSPTPGVCWNAGVQCSGAVPQTDGTTTFESCEAVDKGLDGNAAKEGDAVLHPVDGYVQLFDELRDQKADWAAGVSLVAVTGVSPVDGLPAFATSTDPAFNLEFGIGPSCIDESGAPLATPPVRLRRLLSDFYDAPEPESLLGVLGSICSSDYVQPLGQAADLLRDQVKPGCVYACAADLDSTTAALDFDCEVEQESPPHSDPLVISVPDCLSDGRLPEDADVCASWLTPDDDQHPICAEQGSNLELRLNRRPGHPVPGGTTVRVRCVWTDAVDGVCPS